MQPDLVATDQPAVAKENPNLTFLREHQGDCRIIALQGGARSGKTYSALQFLVSLAYYYSGLLITVVRSGMPALRATALRDFKDIMMSAGLYDEQNESKPSGSYEYHYNGNVTEFFSVDNQQKLRGRKRHILYINEANELTLDQFRQLMLRTEGLVIIDYNPSEPESYIYDQILPRSDCRMLITTYKDNPHLPPAIIEEIELLLDADEEYWRVFGLGQRGNVSGIIYSHYKVLEANLWPTRGEKAYGLDFGFSAPSALIETTFFDEAIYAKQLLYKRKLTNTALIEEMKKLPIDREATIWCDEAEPDRIEELKNAGFNAIKADKPIRAGIDAIRRRPLFIHESGKEMLTEVKGYRYKKNPATGENAEEPIGIGDHCFLPTQPVLTSEGKRPISSIKAGDLVWTRAGWKPVLRSWQTSRNQRVFLYEVSCSIGKFSVSCTANHKLLTQDGWKAISDLGIGDTIWVNSALTETTTISTRGSGIILGMIGACIGTFGSIITDRFRTGIISIIKTAIRTTTRSKICNCAKEVSTSPNTLRSTIDKIRCVLKKIWMPFVRLPKNGTLPKKADSGIVSTPNAWGSEIQTCLSETVVNVESPSSLPAIKMSFVLPNARQSGDGTPESITNLEAVPLVAKPSLLIDSPKPQLVPSRVQRVSVGNLGKHDVYDLHVADCHEFVAGGILVHNCMDAMRYAVYNYYKQPQGAVQASRPQGKKPMSL
ncbi:phage terminase large subunit [Spirosoma fluminis]